MLFPEARTSRRGFLTASCMTMFHRLTSLLHGPYRWPIAESQSKRTKEIPTYPSRVLAVILGPHTILSLIHEAPVHRSLLRSGRMGGRLSLGRLRRDRLRHRTSRLR